MSTAISRYHKTLTIPAGSDSVSDTPPYGLSGLLRAITIVSPSLTASTYGITILGQEGESLFSKTGLLAATKTVILKDSDTQYLQIPIEDDTAPLVNISAIGNGKATGVLTSDNTNVSDGDTVTVGSQVYTFKTAVNGAANQVLIDTTADLSLTNLASAINASAGAGTAYGTGTVANASASSSATPTAHALTLTALNTPGNTVATTKVAAHLSWGAATLTGGGEASSRAFIVDLFIS